MRRWAAETSEAPLPPERAFVVQFRQLVDPSGELFVGRAEHIASGTEVRFGSVEALIAFITDVLIPAPSTTEAHAASKAKVGTAT